MTVTFRLSLCLWGAAAPPFISFLCLGTKPWFLPTDLPFSMTYLLCLLLIHSILILLSSFIKTHTKLANLAVHRSVSMLSLSKSLCPIWNNSLGTRHYSILNSLCSTHNFLIFFFIVSSLKTLNVESRCWLRALLPPLFLEQCVQCTLIQTWYILDEWSMKPYLTLDKKNVGY